MTFRSDLNEKRAKALFEYTDDPTRQPDWDLQPERIKDIFRDRASYNRYTDNIGRHFTWNMDNDKVVIMRTKEEWAALGVTNGPWDDPV
jgi:hypothetical protein